MPNDFRVRAVRCDHRATDEEVYGALARATVPLKRSWEKLEKANRIVLKFNMGHTNVIRFQGRRRELVDDAVCRAVLRLLRERTSATLVAADTFCHDASRVRTDYSNYLPLLDEVQRRVCRIEPAAFLGVRGAGRRQHVPALYPQPLLQRGG